MPSRPITLRTLAVAGCATVLTLAGAPGAQARPLVHTDRTTDVRRADHTPEEPTLVPAPRHHDGDISKVRFANGSVVALRATFDDLKQTNGYRYDLLKVVTNERVVRTVAVITKGDTEQVYVERANGEDVPCRGLKHTTDYDADVAVIHVPRSCLGDPRWVKMGYIAATVTSDARLLFIDDALRDHTASFEGTPVLSDKIWLH
jgi:hypothetical protein